MRREIAFCRTQLDPCFTLKTPEECFVLRLFSGTQDPVGDACFNSVTGSALVNGFEVSNFTFQRVKKNQYHIHVELKFS